MALIITFSSGILREWHLGQRKPLRDDEIKAITKIEADGDEFYHIQDMFSTRDGISKIISCSIPMVNYKNKMTWYGDFAKTIIANL